MTKKSVVQRKLFKEQNYVDGKWLNSDSGETIAVTNPASGEQIGTIPKCGRKEAALAVDAAHAAFQSWRSTLAKDRAALMLKLADLVMENQSELAELLTEEMGKPLNEAKGEVAGTANYIRWFAEEARRVYGDVIPSPWKDKEILVTKEPVGVVAAITPWNFPSAMIARKLGAALAAGCTIIFKPAENTPYSALALAALCEEAGFPPGVVNFVTGVPSEIGDQFCQNPKVRKISFTGSTGVGKHLAQSAGAHMKRISLELGGNAPFIVFDDADIDAAVQGAINCKFRNTGQTCVCANRILVQDSVYEQFSKKFAHAVEKLVVGDGMHKGTTQGPLINEAAVDKVESHISDAVGKGAKVIVGGKRHNLGGTFFEPTLLGDVTSEMRIASEETFGPVAPLFKFKTEEEALSMANDTEYGLACYFYTQSLGRASRVRQQLEYGLVGVNEGVITTEVAPFGGFKESGLGSEGSKYGVDDYLNIKYTCVGGLDR